MKRNLICYFGLAILIGGGATLGTTIVIASEEQDTCSYNPINGNYIENGIEYSFGSWEHARLCAMDGGLPEIVMNRLGALGVKSIREEAERLKITNREMANLRKNKDMKMQVTSDADSLTK